MIRPPPSPVADSGCAHEREPAGTDHDDAGLGIPPGNRRFTGPGLSPTFRLGPGNGPCSNLFGSRSAGLLHGEWSGLVV